MKQQKALKYISKLPLADKLKLQRENQENGRKLHQQHLDANEKRNHQRLERILEGYTDADGNHVDGLKDTWKGTGYNSKEMEMLEEAWSLSVIKDKSTYQEDKKKRKSLIKQANASLASRKNNQKMITIQIEPADNGVVKFLIDDNVNGGGEEFTSRVVYEFDNTLGRANQVKFLKDIVIDLGLNTGSDLDGDKLVIKTEWGAQYTPNEAELKLKVANLQKELKRLQFQLKK